MNLSDYSKLPKNNASYIKWTKNGEVKVLRFLYTSKDGADIEVRAKEWDEAQKRFVYDTPTGRLTCMIDCVLYEDGQEPKRVRWERSAAFVEQAVNGYWSKFPRIVDGVWEVTCTNPGTKDIKFAWFPVQGADFTTHPLPKDISIQNGKIVYGNQEQESSAEPEPTGAKRYWE